MIVIILWLLAIFYLVFWAVSYILLPLVTGEKISFTLPQPFQAVLIGVGIFILGQILQKFALSNINEFKKIVGKIHFQLLFYSDEISNLGKLRPKKILRKDLEKLSPIEHNLRKLTSEMMATYASVPMKDLFFCLNFIPSSKNVFYAANKLLILTELIKKAGYTEAELLDIGLTKSEVKYVNTEKMLYDDIFNDINEICQCLKIESKALHTILKEKKLGIEIVPSFLDE